MYDRRARRTSPADAVRARTGERKDKEQNRSGGGRGGFLMQGARTRGRKGGKPHRLRMVRMRGGAPDKMSVNPVGEPRFPLQARGSVV